MSRMTIYNDRNSPAAARVTLTRMKNFSGGDVSALSGVLAGSPGVLEACTEYAQQFIQGSLEHETSMLVLLVASREFGNEYCNDLVTRLARLNKQSSRVAEAVRKGRKLPKKSHRALADFVETVIQKGGDIQDEELERLRKAGYSDQHVLEIMMGISIAWLWSSISGVAGLSLDAKSDE